MTESDFKLVAFVLFFVSVWGVFMFMFASNPYNDQYGNTTYPEQNYTTPESTGFFDTIRTAWSLSFSHPELFWINVTFFGVIAALLVLVFIRFLRGQ